LAFAIITAVHNREVNLETHIPALFLQGTGEKVSLDALKLKKDDIVKRENAETNSACITFKGSDDDLYNVAAQAAGEIVKWLNALFTR
jgi:hypothetical protein